jgi:hypothetical protein
MANLPEPESDEQFLAWSLRAAFVASRPESRLCYSLAYARIAKAEGFGLHEDFWLDLARQVRAHFKLKE